MPIFFRKMSHAVHDFGLGLISICAVAQKRLATTALDRKVYKKDITKG
jgi:hypothetical protein